MIQNTLPAIVAYLLAVNASIFLLFGYDKRQACQNGWRISERALLLSALLGPFWGIAGMKIFRRKTRKVTFLILVPLCAAAHVAGFIVIAGAMG
jgi:uncharacterized membrane protein YsdA (DUF1294 family)